MKNKIIIFFILLLVILIPSVTKAYIIYPANLTVVVASTGQESLFNFKIQYLGEECKEVCGYDENNEWFCQQDCQSVWKDQESFSLQTENLTSSHLVENIWPNGTRVVQDDAIGFKISGIICVSNNQNDLFNYQQNGVVIHPQSGSNITCTFTNTKAKNPVLIVPGVMGTEMKKGEEKIWPNVPKMITNITDDFMDVLSFDGNLKPTDEEVYGNNVIREEPLFDYTNGLMNEFTGQGYIENETLFTFSYDWRYGVSGKYANGKTNSDLLEEKIQAILVQTGADEVDVVAHSMGGLVVKKYVIDNPSDNNIGKAVFVGVPNTGSPKSVKVLLQGDNMDVSGLNDAEVKKISQNFPASYDLLPSRQYYDTSYLALVDMSKSTEKSLNYDESKNYLTDDKGLNEQALTGAENLHTQSFDSYDLRIAGVDLYSITGCKSPTIAQVAEVKSKDVFGNYRIAYDVLKETSGDGTVPFGSADSIMADDDNVFYAIKANHGKMPSQDGIRQEIVNLISGSSLDVGSNVITRAALTADNAKCQLTGFWISKHSPVSIEVLDQNGKRAGIVSDGSIQNDIPGADYEVMGEQAFIFLPTDENQTYQVNMQGAGSGTYTIKVQNVINSQAGETEVFSNLPVTGELTGQINLGSTTTLSVKQTAGNSVETILPSATLSASQSEDYFAPVSTATLAGTAGQTGFYRSDVKVDIKATDNLSGVLNVEYNLDGAGYQKNSGDTATAAVSAEGKHTITFFATDKAGNNETEQTITFTIDKTAPEAVIQFDKDAKDLKFTGADNISDSSLVLVSDKSNVITLTDQAGNITELTMQEKNRKISMRAGIKSLKYNGVSVAKFQNMMVFFWVYDRKNNLVTLSQSVLTKKGYNISAVYNGKKTTVIGRDASGPVIKSFNGLKIIKITTNKGDLRWSY